MKQPLSQGGVRVRTHPTEWKWASEANATYSRYLVSSSTTQYKYITQNGKVVRETIIKGGVTRVLDYIYDESGRPSSVIFKDGTADEVTYYYVLNLQGDVEKIIDANGVIQAIYSYDPWGKILSITSGTGASVNDTHIGKLNSLRYRGYHGDTETQWYYLQSRYMILLRVDSSMQTDMQAQEQEYVGVICSHIAIIIR